MLRLGSNGLRTLPAELSQLSHLRELYLHGNSLPASELEPILPSLSELEVISTAHLHPVSLLRLPRQ